MVSKNFCSGIGLRRNAAAPTGRSRATALRTTTGIDASTGIALHRVEHLVPVDERHHQVEDDEVGQLLAPRALQEFERLTAVAGGNHVIAFRLQKILKDVSNLEVIFSQQNRLLRHAPPPCRCDFVREFRELEVSYRAKSSVINQDVFCAVSLDTTPRGRRGASAGHFRVSRRRPWRMIGDR